MSTYKFIVPPFRAIQDATIVNDGITVIAGENGCGKSTFSRMVYYLINIMCDFSSYVFDSTKDSIRKEVAKIEYSLEQTTSSLPRIDVISKGARKIKNSNGFDELEDNLRSLVDDYNPILLDYFTHTINEPRKIERILNYFDVQKKGETPEDFSNACLDTITKSFENIINKGKESIAKRTKSMLIDYVAKYGDDLDNFPRDIKFQEDDVDLINLNNFRSPLASRRAIYIDTPMAVNDNLNLQTSHWSSLSTLLNQDEVDVSEEEKRLLFKLHKIIHGDIKIKKDSYIFNSKLRYQRDHGLDIGLVNAATGIKSFAYLQKLLANGLLRSDTVLIIDEPEAHLHPQWIVDFARVLVLLNKQLGVKVMITSHNPDMVAAIRAISDKEGILEKTRFYLAEPSPNNSYRYTYQDLEQNIGPIFESFNIALSRIEEYGTGSNN